MPTSTAPVRVGGGCPEPPTPPRSSTDPVGGGVPAAVVTTRTCRPYVRRGRRAADVTVYSCSRQRGGGVRWPSWSPSRRPRRPHGGAGRVADGHRDRRALHRLAERRGRRDVAAPRCTAAGVRGHRGGVVSGVPPRWRTPSRPISLATPSLGREAGAPPVTPFAPSQTVPRACSGALSAPWEAK